MKTFVIMALAIVLVLECTVVSAGAASVVQGECLGYNKTARVVTLREYDTNFSADYRYGRPTSIVSRFDVSRAKIGIPPGKGDILRIAYELEKSGKIGIKVMNVSKQDLMEK